MTFVEKNDENYYLDSVSEEYPEEHYEALTEEEEYYHVPPKLDLDYEKKMMDITIRDFKMLFGKNF